MKTCILPTEPQQYHLTRAQALWCFTILFLLSCMHVRAQLPGENYDLYNVKSGLPHNMVQAMLQDSEGLLWIGTYNGLAVYDGNNFRTQAGVFGKATSANWFHAIEVIFEDRKGNIWIGSRGGLVSCFVKNQQAFRQYDNNDRVLSRIRCFYEDMFGRIWIGDDRGNVGMVTGNRLRYHKTGGAPVLAISASSKDSLVVLTKDGLDVLVIPKGRIVKMMPLTRSDMIISGSHFNDRLVVHRHGVTLIDTRHFRVVREIQYPAGLGNTGNNKFLFSRSGDYYYTNGFIVQEYTADGKLKNSFNISDNGWYDNNQIINCIAEDRNGVLWAGTNSGIVKIDKKKYRFTKYTQNNIAGKITNNYVRGIYADGKDNLWIGFKNGRVNLLRYNKQEHAYRFKASFGLVEKNGNELRGYTINTFLRLSTGQLLAGGEAGLFLFDNATKKFLPFLPDILPGDAYGVWCLYEDKGGNIWIGSNSRGMFIVENGTNIVYNYTHNNHKSAGSLPGNDVWNIYEDRKGDVWIGTGSGLVKTISSGKTSGLTFKKYTSNRREKMSVWVMTEDSLDNLWIGTVGHGMFRLDKKQDKIIAYGSKPDYVISSIVPDTLGNLWIGTVNGLYRFNTGSGSLVSFNDNDGLVSSDFNFKAAAATPNGELFFGSKTGMVSFFPQNIHPTDTGGTPVLITSVIVAGEDSTKAIYKKGPIKLSYRQNAMVMTFSIPEFSSKEKHKYRYILKGFDQKWNYTDYHNPRAVYTNVPPGKYQFVVEGTTNGLKWDHGKVILDFHIQPAWWQQPLFAVAVGLCIVILLSALLYYRVRAKLAKERRKHDVEKQIADLELKALQAQMNPHFIFNTINSIQHFILQRDELTAYNYLSKFARLMRLFLESSKNKFISLEDECEMLELYLTLEHIRYEERFDFDITVEPTLNKIEVMIPSMLLQPFVENAVKHGLAGREEGGKLTVSFSSFEHSENVIKCVIDDNGIGRQKAAEVKRRKEHISRGMQLIEDRISTYNFINEGNITLEITDKSAPAAGTTVTILIPVFSRTS